MVLLCVVSPSSVEVCCGNQLFVLVEGGDGVMKGEARGRKPHHGDGYLCTYVSDLNLAIPTASSTRYYALQQYCLSALPGAVVNLAIA